MSKIRIDQLSFRYKKDSNYILEKLSLEFEKGQNVLIIGDNGSGKSTFGKLICGLLTPTLGRITLDDKELHKLNPKNRIHKALYLNQLSQLQILNNSIEKEIKFTQRISKKKESKIDYSKFMLPMDKNYNPFELSINELWRFSIYLSSIIDPDILFIDEIPSVSNEINLAVLKLILDYRATENKHTFISYQRDIKDINFDSKHQL